MIDIQMVSNLGSYAVAAVGLTTQPKFLGLSCLSPPTWRCPPWWPRRRGENRREDANQVLVTALTLTVAGLRGHQPPLRPACKSDH